MASKLQPLADWIVAEQEEAATKTASGLYIPDKAAEKPKVAKVIKTGTKVKEIKLDGTEFILVKEEDVLATVK